MSTVHYDSSLFPIDRRPKRRGWLSRLFFGPGTPERPRAKRVADDRPQELPKFLRREEASTGDVRPIPGRHYPRPPALSDYEPKQEPTEEPDMQRNRLNEIASLVRSLTYAEMLELSQALWERRPNEVEPLDDRMLPGVLHKWSESRS
jgi:hypothetical protein